eukprot:s306_g3.t1
MDPPVPEPECEPDDAVAVEKLREILQQLQEPEQNDAVLEENLTGWKLSHAEPNVDLLCLQHQLWNSLAMHVPQQATSGNAVVTKFLDPHAAAGQEQFWDAIAQQFQPMNRGAQPGQDSTGAGQGSARDLPAGQEPASQVAYQDQGFAQSSWDPPDHIMAAQEPYGDSSWDPADYWYDEPWSSWDEEYTEDEWLLWNSMSRRQRYRAQYGREKPRGGQNQDFYKGKFGRSSKP